MTDHLYRLDNEGIKRVEQEIDDSFPYVQVIDTTLNLVPWFVDYVNHLVRDIIPKDLNLKKWNKFLHNMNIYFWDEPH